MTTQRRYSYARMKVARGEYNSIVNERKRGGKYAKGQHFGPASKVRIIFSKKHHEQTETIPETTDD